MTVQLRQCAAPCCNETRLPWGPFCSAWCRETTELDNQAEIEAAFLTVPEDDAIAKAIWFELEKSYGRWRDYMDVHFSVPSYGGMVYSLEDEDAGD